MAHGLNPLIKREIECNSKSRSSTNNENSVMLSNVTVGSVVGGFKSSSPTTSTPTTPPTTAKMGSRRIFTPQFKLQVLDSYRNDSDCKGNQRATARKYGIHRRQIQKWLQCESNLRSSVFNCNKSNCTIGNCTVNKAQSVAVVPTQQGTPGAQVSSGLIDQQQPQYSPNTNHHITVPRTSPHYQPNNFYSTSQQQQHQQHHNPSTVGGACSIITTATVKIQQTTHLMNGNPTTAGSASNSMVSLDSTRHSVASNSHTNTLAPLGGHHNRTNTFTPQQQQQQQQQHVVQPQTGVAAGFVSPVLSHCGSESAASISLYPESSASLPNSPIAVVPAAPVTVPATVASLNLIHRDFISPPIINHHQIDFIDGQTMYHHRLGYEMSLQHHGYPYELPTPIDLSLNRKHRHEEFSRTPSPYCCGGEWQNSAASTSGEEKFHITDLSGSADAAAEAWDLSCRKRKHFATPQTVPTNKYVADDRREDHPIAEGATPPKVVKLFKPYLLHQEDDDTNSEVKVEDPEQDHYESLEKKYKDSSESGNGVSRDPIIWSHHPCSPIHCYNEPTSNGFPYPNEYNLYPSPPYPSVTAVSGYWGAHGSPKHTGGYDSSGASVSSLFSGHSDCGDGSSPPHYTNAAYTVDFKLQNIESYYHDMAVRGSQRPIANKHNIHKHEVQKWLHQEDDLGHQRMVIG